jgi:hypothetical protein
MRFTWIALSVLLLALASHGTSAAVPSSTDALPDPETATRYGALSSELPVAVMPAASGETRLARVGSEVASRYDASLDCEGDPLGARSARAICVRIRTVDRAGLAFLPELTRATTGFLSSCTTACPPPASR